MSGSITFEISLPDRCEILIQFLLLNELEPTSEVAPARNDEGLFPIRGLRIHTA